MYDAVDHLLALDPGRRGIAAFFEVGGARRAAEALAGSRRVLITTRFLVEPKIVETDGPPGAAVLGRALRRLGAEVTYVSDSEAIPVLSAALRAVGEPPAILAYGDDRGTASEIMERLRPTHLIAIERPARSGAGDYLNMRGQSTAEWNGPIDELFVMCRRRAGAVRPVAIGVVDGGNEVGAVAHGELRGD